MSRAAEEPRYSELCPVTSKRKYASHDAARRAMRGLSARLRIYRCPNCGSLHLTKEESAKGRKFG